ncbi:hypothetical protein HN51_054811 [Arachis hypogaea]
MVALSLQHHGCVSCFFYLFIYCVTGYILFSAQKTLVACSSNRHILSVKGRFQHCFMSCTRFIYESFSYNMNNVQCMEIFLCGYWVGPDDDDGWGFVEAVINQIT